MKRILAAVLTALFILPLQGHAVTLKIATLAPDGTAWMNKMRDGAAEIAKRTEGRVKLRFYPGGIMGNDKALLRKIRIGQLHGGVITGGGLAMILPDANIYSVPFAFRSYEEVDYVRSRMDPMLIVALEKEGYVSFGLGEAGFAYLMSDAPVRDVADLKGHKVWIPEGDTMSRAAFEAVGVSPVSLPLTDVLTGLQTGLVDTIGSSTVGAVALQWHTRVKYVTDLPLMYLYGTMIVSDRAFKRISEKDRVVVREVMGRVAEELDRQSREDNRAARKALEQQGIEFLSVSANDTTTWRKALSSTIDMLANKGVYTRDALEVFKRHLNEFRQTAL